jgi:glycerol-3-phosphate cytidylyltransferase
MKILSRDEAKTKIAELKSSGKKIVFTNGCFDILHIGHIRYLKEAKALGDVLIIGLNSDESVKKLKGEGRPVQSEQERAEILSALEVIDYVVIFNEDTPKEIILELKPDIQAKGGDYKEDEIPEKEALESYGGELRILSKVDCDSTTELISKL